MAECNDFQESQSQGDRPLKTQETQQDTVLDDGPMKSLDMDTCADSKKLSPPRPSEIIEHQDIHEDDLDYEPGSPDTENYDADSIDSDDGGRKEQNDNIGSTSQTSSPTTPALSGDQMWAMAIKFKLRVIDFVHKHGIEAAVLCCQLDEQVVKDWMGLECVLRKMEGTISPNSIGDDDITNISSSSGTQTLPGKGHTSYTIEFKLKVVNFAKKYNIAQTANHFGVARKQVSEWKKNESKLIAKYHSNLSAKRLGSEMNETSSVQPGNKTVASYDDVSSSSPVLLFTKENQKESDEIRQMLEKSKCGSSHRGKKIKSYDVEFKLLVVEFAKEHSNNETARHFQIDKKQVREWKKHEGRLRSMEKAGLNILRGRGRKLRYPVVDTLLMSWLVELQAQGVFVSEKAIKLKASELHMEKGDSDFKASSGWIRSFCKRNNIQIPKSGRGPGRPCKNSADSFSHGMEDLQHDNQFEEDTVDIHFENESLAVQDAGSTPGMSTGNIPPQVV